MTELEAKLRALEMSGFWSVPEGCSDSGDENKRDQLRRLTLSVDKLSEGSPEPEVSGDLLLDPFPDSEVLDRVPSPGDTLLLCDDSPPDEYTQLLSRSAMNLCRMVYTCPEFHCFLPHMEHPCRWRRRIPLCIDKTICQSSYHACRYRRSCTDLACTGPSHNCFQ